MAFFYQAVQGPQQDGAGKSPSSDSCHHSPTARSGSPSTRKSPHASSSPAASTPLMGSPAKSRIRMEDNSDLLGELTPTCNSLDVTMELPDSIASFPTSNQPIMDATMKDMLLSLRDTIHADILHITRQFKEEMHAVRSRVEHIENKMDEFVHTINDLVDAHDEHMDEHTWIKAKLANPTQQPICKYFWLIAQ